MKPIRIESINSYDWEQLLSISQSEGSGIVKRFITDFRAATNRFNAPGEALFVHLSGNTVIASAGLNIEPDNCIPMAGRIRRLYVIPEYRSKGLGRSLIDEIELIAKNYFNILTVNVGKLPARGFYEHINFVPVEHPSITHKKKIITQPSTSPDSPAGEL